MSQAPSWWEHPLLRKSLKVGAEGVKLALAIQNSKSWLGKTGALLSVAHEAVGMGEGGLISEKANLPHLPLGKEISDLVFDVLFRTDRLSFFQKKSPHLEYRICDPQSKLTLSWLSYETVEGKANTLGPWYWGGSLEEAMSFLGRTIWETLGLRLFVSTTMYSQYGLILF